MAQKRPLTHDEKKASEAAFRGLPFNPNWSQSAKAVYDGIVAIKDKAHIPSSPAETLPALQQSTAEAAAGSPDAHKTEAAETLPAEVGLMKDHSVQQIHSRREAIEAGYLMDVSIDAKNIGLELAVGMTRPLWERGICPSDDLSQDDLHGRIRDVLMAVRLRLAGLESPAAFVEVPVLLAFPPDSIPELFLVYALFHKDPLEADSLLLLHPEEVSLSKQSFAEN